MTIERPTPPKTMKELFARLNQIIQHGEYVMPASYRGTGAPGLFLEDLLGLPNTNKDTPDAGEWEIKYYTRKTALITLFHKEPSPRDVVRFMVSKWGWRDDDGRMCFRHTIRGKSKDFYIDSDAEQVIVRRIGGNGLVPHWTHDDLLSIAGGKLRRLLLVRGERGSGKRAQRVIYDRVDLYQNLQLTYFIAEVLNGTVAIDFDAREARPDSQALRNHGTKFRIQPENICRLYARKERIG
jgi:hypothetical protein